MEVVYRRKYVTEGGGGTLDPVTGGTVERGTPQGVSSSWTNAGGIAFRTVIAVSKEPVQDVVFVGARRQLPDR